MSSSNCCFLTCIQVSQEAGQMVWYAHIFQNSYFLGNSKSFRICTRNRIKVKYILPVISHNIAGGICDGFVEREAHSWVGKWRRKGLWKSLRRAFPARLLNNPLCPVPIARRFWGALLGLHLGPGLKDPRTLLSLLIDSPNVRPLVKSHSPHSPPSTPR